ncbi:MAG: hypothetical protein E6929_03445 [Clostridium sp.]|nr:hypothetical protein [Clostridium sp.]
MESIVINYIKEKSKILYSICSLIVVIYFVIIKSSKFKEILNKMKEVLEKNYNKLPSLIIFILLMVALIYILKVSDRKSNKKVSEYLESQKIKLNTTGNKEISASISQGYEYVEGKRVEIIRVIIANEANKTIKQLLGRLSFYYENNKLKEIPIILNNLYNGYSATIYNEEISREIYNWNHFDCHIDKMIMSDEERRDVILRSSRLRRTYYFGLNIDRFLDYKIWGINTKYNLVWIKEKLIEVKSAVRFFTQKKYGCNYKFINQLFERISLFLKRLLVYIGIVSIIIIIIYSFIDTIILFKEIIVKLI